jgi:hypothetical protein
MENIIKNKNKTFWMPGVPVGCPCPLGAVGRILVHKYVMLYQSNIFFERLLYMGDSENKIKWVSSENCFLAFFCKGPPLQKKMVKIDQKFFFYQDITIHTPIESPCRVDKKRF